jgi:hypothetical protein
MNPKIPAAAFPANKASLHIADPPEIGARPQQLLG